jgi:hypothetical protein
MHPHHTPLEKLVLLVLTLASISIVEYFMRRREQKDEDNSHGDW